MSALLLCGQRKNRANAANVVMAMTKVSRHAVALVRKPMSSNAMSE